MPPSSSAMRIVVLSHAYVDPAARGKLRALAGLGCTVAALVPERWEEPGIGWTHAQWEEDAGVQIVPIPVRGDTEEPGGLAWRGRAIRRALKEMRPEIVHVEEDPWTRAAARAAAEARRLRVPATGFSRETIPEPLPMRLAFRRRRVLRRLRGVVSLNPVADGLLAAAYPALSRIVGLQIGVNPPVAAAAGSGGRFVMGFVGRLIPEKGLDLLLRASVRLVGPWSLLVSGTGPAQIELEGLAERLGIAARVSWLGAQPREDRDRIWTGLDCFVAPSRSTRHWVETSSQGVITAMAHGIPVVAAKSGALPGIVGDAGVVVPEDDVSALAETLQRLLDAPAERQATGAAGRRRAMAEYSDAALARRLLEFWRSLTPENV